MEGVEAEGQEEADHGRQAAVEVVLGNAALVGRQSELAPGGVDLAEEVVGQSDVHGDQAAVVGEGVGHGRVSPGVGVFGAEVSLSRVPG